ncbi:MAG: hypothetical protein AB1592_12860 [Pseudomonadota bacterium]
MFSYRHEGSDWVVEIRARDARDARERMKSLAFARYDGELIATLPAEAGPLMRLVAWLRNNARTLR